MTNKQIIVFDHRIFNILMDLKRRRKRGNLNITYSDLIKTKNFKDTTKEYLEDRINTLIIKDKIINKKAGIWIHTLSIITQKL